MYQLIHFPMASSPLQELASKATELETQVAKTAAELSEYKAESKNIRNQDVTIRRLEERVRLLEAELEEKDEEVAAAREEAAAELEARSADDARQREERLEAELSRAEAALEAMRRMHQSTQAQLFSVQERGEEAAAAARAEAALTAAEIERAEERLLQLAKERDALLDKVHGEGGDASKPAAADVSSAQVTALREEIKTQRDLISRLQAELAGASKKAAAEAAAAAAKVASLEVTLSATEAHATALEGELAGRPTQKELEEARQQVRVLNAVLHNTVGEEDDEAGTPGQGGTSAAAADGHVVGSLETALLAKNRHLEHKLTMAHLEAAEARTAAEAASASLAEAEAEVERQKALITRLEEDLIAAEDAGGLAGSEGGTGGDGGDASNAMLARTPSSGGDQTLLSVLSAQRDRLRGRVQELEAQSAAAQHAVVKAKQDLEAARADNVALVERLRYVQGYAKGGGDLEAGSAAVNRYMRDYEEKVNPFTGKEPTHPPIATCAFVTAVSQSNLVSPFMPFFLCALQTSRSVNEPPGGSKCPFKTAQPTPWGPPWFPVTRWPVPPSSYTPWPCT